LWGFEVEAGIIAGVLDQRPDSGAPACQIQPLTPKKVKGSNNEKAGKDFIQCSYFGKIEVKHFSLSSWFWHELYF
jgi:hypothetical protein